MESSPLVIQRPRRTDWSTWFKYPSELDLRPAEVEFNIEVLDFDKSCGTGSVGCLPSSHLPVGTEIEVSSAVPQLVKCTLWIIRSPPIILDHLFSLEKSQKSFEVGLSSPAQLVCLKFLQCGQVFHVTFVTPNERISESTKVPPVSADSMLA